MCCFQQKASFSWWSSCLHGFVAFFPSTRWTTEDVGLSVSPYILRTIGSLRCWWGFSNLFLLTRVGQFFTLFTFIVGWDLVVLIALHCTLLLHCLGQVGPIFAFRFRRVRRHWTFFIAWLERHCTDLTGLSRDSGASFWFIFAGTCKFFFPFWKVVSEWTLLGCGLRRRLHQFPLPISWYADFCFSLQVGGPLSFGRYFLSHLRTQVRCTVVLWSREYWSTIPPHLLERGTKSESPKMPLLLGEGHTHVIPLSSSHLLNFYVMYTSTLWLQVGGMKASETHPFGRWFAWWWPQTFLKVLRPTTNPVVISCIWQKEPNHLCFYTCSCPKPHSFLFVTNFIFF